MTIGICAIIKNEHLYLKEWIDYHLSIGVNHIWLFEDYDSDSHADIVSEYNDVVTLFPFSITGAAPGNPIRQCAVYEWFCREYKDKMDWCAFIDIDEFIILEDGVTLKELCNRLVDTDFNGFVLYWKIYDANGHIKRPIGNIMDNFTHESDSPISFTWQYKTVVNMHKSITNWPVCHTPQNVCDTLGRRIDSRMRLNEKTFSGGYLAHYFTKSWEDWKIRLKRGNILARNRKAEMFFYMNPDMRKIKDELIKTIDI